MHRQPFHQLMLCPGCCQTALAALASQSLDAERSIAVFLGDVDGPRRGVDAGDVQTPLSWDGAGRLF